MNRLLGASFVLLCASLMASCDDNQLVSEGSPDGGQGGAVGTGGMPGTGGAAAGGGGGAQGSLGGLIASSTMAAEDEDRRSTTYLYNHFVGKFFGARNDQNLLELKKELDKDRAFRSAEIVSRTTEVSTLGIIGS